MEPEKIAGARKNVSSDYLTESERNLLTADKERMSSMRNDRDRVWPHFDDMTYLTRHEINEKLYLGYIPPAKSKDDVRVNTGVTKERINSLVSALIYQDFSWEFTATTPDGRIDADASRLATDAVMHARERAQYRNMRQRLYGELLSQGNVHVLVRHGKTPVQTKDGFKAWDTKEDPSKTQIVDGKTEWQEGVEYVHISGTKVYWGDIREPDKMKQPYAAFIEDIPLATAQAEYSSWYRWQFVPLSKDEAQIDSTEHREWTSLDLKDGYVRRIWLLDKTKGTAQLYLNWVPMMPYNYPMTELEPGGTLPIAEGACEEMPFFAYAKGYCDKTKVEGAVLDEIVRAYVLALRKEQEPPLINATGRTLSRDMFLSGAITDVDVNEVDKIQPLMRGIPPSNTLTVGASFMKEIISNKTVNEWLAAENLGDRTTATQYEGTRMQTLMRIVIVIDGVRRFEERLAWLTLFHEMKYPPKGFSVDGFGNDGTPLRTEYRFSAEEASKPDTFEEMTRLRMESVWASERNGKRTEVAYVNPSAIFSLRYWWQARATSKPELTLNQRKANYIADFVQMKQVFPNLDEQPYLDRIAALSETGTVTLTPSAPINPMGESMIGAGMAPQQGQAPNMSMQM